MQGRLRRVRVEQVTHMVVIGSGKGGVGKSTVSVNLAVALAQRGAQVGLLDADTYGPSVPMMLGVRKRNEGQGWSATLPLGQRGQLTPNQMLQPLQRYGVKVMSVGFFIGEEQAVAPMPDVQGMLIRQLLNIVNWGKLDYLLIDLPPGNGEPQATLCRELQLHGAILVTTPQDVARIDTAKGLGMFQSAGIPILGLIQNMAGFFCPHCGERIDIFPQSSEEYSHLHDVPFLGAIPLDPATARSGDAGKPVVVSVPESPVSAIIQDIAGQVADRLAADQARQQQSFAGEVEEGVS
ncbi:MAG TPA: P-loop NTPase [Ktedonobacteraceae bacterium]|nr:P-loop NTPase [Ktedonobacteraceae bacterium]